LALVNDNRDFIDMGTLLVFLLLKNIKRSAIAKRTRPESVNLKIIIVIIEASINKPYVTIGIKLQRRFATIKLAINLFCMFHVYLQFFSIKGFRIYE